MSRSSDNNTDGTLREDQLVYRLGVTSQQSVVVGVHTGIVIYWRKPHHQGERYGQRPKEPNGYQEI